MYCYVVVVIVVVVVAVVVVVDTFIVFISFLFSGCGTLTTIAAQTSKKSISYKFLFFHKIVKKKK